VAVQNTGGFAVRSRSWPPTPMAPRRPWSGASPREERANGHGHPARGRGTDEGRDPDGSFRGREPGLIAPGSPERTGFVAQPGRLIIDERGRECSRPRPARQFDLSGILGRSQSMKPAGAARSRHGDCRGMQEFQAMPAPGRQNSSNHHKGEHNGKSSAI